MASPRSSSSWREERLAEDGIVVLSFTRGPAAIPGSVWQLRPSVFLWYARASEMLVPLLKSPH